jgi:hypothetical protein
MNHLITAYRTSWTVVAILTATIGLAMAFLLTPADVMIALTILAARIGSVLAVGHWSENDRLNLPTNPPQAILLGVGTTAALIATTGYITVLGPAATGLPALLAASSPAVLTWLGRHLPKLAPTANTAYISTPTSAAKWHDTYYAIRKANTTTAQLRIIQTRQHLLNELERRNPTGIAAWLATTARGPDRLRTTAQRGRGCGWLNLHAIRFDVEDKAALVTQARENAEQLAERAGRTLDPVAAISGDLQPRPCPWRLLRRPDQLRVRNPHHPQQHEP